MKQKIENIKVGSIVDVRLQNYGEPKFREFLGFKIRKEDSYKWLYWYYKPQGAECGYSGVREDHPLFLGASLEVSPLATPKERRNEQ